MKTSAEDVSMRPPVGLATAMGQQLRLMGRDRKWLYLTGALVIFLAIASTDVGDAPPALPLLFVVGIVGSLVASLWAVAVWDQDGPDRTYHWSLPISRSRNDLARVVAGGIYLLASFLLLLVTGFAIGGMTGELPALLEMEVRSYVNFLLAPLLVYLLATPFVLWRHAMTARWWILGIVAFFIMALWLPPFERFLDAVFNPNPGSLSTALFGAFLDDAFPPGGGPEAWWPAATFWLGLALAATVFTTLFRPADLRHMIRSDR